MTRATSDLLFNGNSLKNVIAVECLTLDGEEIQEHKFDLSTGEVESEDQNKADPALNAIMSMIKNQQTGILL